MSDAKCISCGGSFTRMFATQRKCMPCMNGSTQEAALDRMVEQASTPSLASLFRQAKDQGLLPEVQQYPTE